MVATADTDTTMEDTDITVVVTEAVDTDIMVITDIMAEDITAADTGRTMAAIGTMEATIDMEDVTSTGVEDIGKISGILFFFGPYSRIFQNLHS